jgi:hypothetical protein
MYPLCIHFESSNKFWLNPEHKYILIVAYCTVRHLKYYFWDSLVQSCTTQDENQSSTTRPTKCVVSGCIGDIIGYDDYYFENEHILCTHVFSVAALLPPSTTVPPLQEAPNLMTRQDTTAKCPVNFTSPSPRWSSELTTILGPTLAPKAHSAT